MTLELERLDALAQAAVALAGELDLGAVLESIVAAAARVTGARYAALGVVGEDQTITKFVTHGTDEETIRRIGHYPTGKGLLGLLIRDPRIIRLDDIGSHPASSGFPAHHPEMGNFLGTPVRSGGRVYGNLYLTEKPGGFTEEDERIIEVLSAQAGAAIENALLSEQLRTLAVQEERDRISRDLHDGVIQALFSIGMSLESARSFVDSDPAKVDERLDAAVDAIDGAIRELRNYIFRLRPHQAASLGLARGLTELAREHEVNALVRPTLELDRTAERAVPDALVPDLLQIVREALSNAARHAGASHVRVTVRLNGDELLVAVADDGAGFTPTAARVGRGLENINERSEALGAKLRIDSTPGQGTELEIRMPLRREP